MQSSIQPALESEKCITISEKKCTPTISERYHTNGICYQRYEKRLEQEKDCRDGNFRAAEENLEKKS